MWVPAVAMAADASRIGVAMAVTGKVTVVGDDQKPSHALRARDAVFAGESLTTATGGSAVVEFRDHSTFEIAPQGWIVLAPFDANPAPRGLVKSVMVEAGAFRSIDGAGSSRTIIATPQGAFTGHGAVVVGQVTPQRVVVFPVDGAGSFTYVSGKVDVPAGGAVVAESDTGTAVGLTHVADDAAMTGLMAEALDQLGHVAAAPTRTAGRVGHGVRPIGRIASTFVSAVGADGYIRNIHPGQGKQETQPETEVRATRQEAEFAATASRPSPPHDFLPPLPFPPIANPRW